jgi:hypothetical protein
MKEVPYEPADTVRFSVLRLNEDRSIKAPPQLLAQATDWGFVNELKKEPRYDWPL